MTTDEILLGHSRSSLASRNTREINTITKRRRCPPCFGTEALFAPATSAWKFSSFSVLANTICAVAVLTREQFEQIALLDPEWSIYVQLIRSSVADCSVTLAGLYSGLPDVVIDKFWDTIANHADQAILSEQLGICAEYLINHFRDAVQEYGAGATTTFTELSKIFWFESGQFQGFNGSAEHICPRDGLQGSSIVDTMGNSAGKANQFVSWCWNYNIETVVSALSLWAERNQVDIEKTWFWMCFFCNNQRKLLMQQTVDPNLADAFSERLQQIGCMLIVLDAYQTPYYTKRVWCIYETYMATAHSLPIDVALPQANMDLFYKTLKLGGFAQIAETLTAIDAEHAEASFKGDEDMIKSLIRNTTGFASVNESVKSALVNWLAGAFGDCLKMDSVSYVTKNIFSLIYRGEVSSTSAFYLSHWIRAVRDQPELIQYLGLEGILPEDSYELFDAEYDALPGVSVADLDHFLQAKAKCNSDAFVTWLQSVDGNDAVVRIREDLKEDLKERLEDLRQQLLRDSNALKNLTNADELSTTTL